MITLRQAKQKLRGYYSTLSKKGDVFTLRESFFYTSGKSTQTFIDAVLKAFPNAEIVESREVWKSFRGGASVANQSHWLVKFRVNS